MLGKDEQKKIQHAIRKFQFIARAIDGTILIDISSSNANQAAPTEETMQQKRSSLTTVRHYKRNWS